MSIPPYPPQNTPPPGYMPPPGGGYVPPQAPQRRSGGCWLWGFLSCLVLVLLAAGIVAYSFYSLARSPRGRSLMNSFNSAMKAAPKVAACQQKMKDVRAAVLRYHTHTGSYPPNLQALVPTYLDPSALHCEMDPNPSPTHVTFAYFRPQEGAPGSTPLLSFHWKYSLELDNQKQMIDTEIIMRLDGQMVNSQSQSSVTQHGGYTVIRRSDGTREIVPNSNKETMPPPPPAH